MSPAATLTLPQKFETLETVLNAEIMERQREIGTAMIALVARVHHFTVGPPGTAKSLMVDRITRRIEGMENGGYFRWLLTQYTTPEEIFGPPSLEALMRGVYKQVTDRKLPVAWVAFLDEIFKANSSILNALLTIMNERLFFNDGDNEEVDLSTIFAASNELPQDNSLIALYDRLHFRHEVRPLQDGGAFLGMLAGAISRAEFPDKILSWDDVRTAQTEAAQVNLPNDILEALKLLRDNLRAQGVEPTERRFVESLKIIRGAAWLGGRATADIDDLRTLRHVMWTRLEDQRVVERAVLELANPIDKEAHDLLERVEALDLEFKKAVEEGDNPKAIAKAAVEIHTKLHKTKERMDDLIRRCADNGRQSEGLEALHRKFVEVATVLMQQGFGLQGRPNV